MVNKKVWTFLLANQLRKRVKGRPESKTKARGRERSHVVWPPTEMAGFCLASCSRTTSGSSFRDTPLCLKPVALQLLVSFGIRCIIQPQNGTEPESRRHHEAVCGPPARGSRFWEPLARARDPHKSQGHGRGARVGAPLTPRSRDREVFARGLCPVNTVVPVF